jgi:Tol biopolymer transport system component
MRDVASGRTKTVLPADGVYGFRFSVSPDGKQVAYDGGGGTGYMGRDTELKVITLDTMQVRDVGIGHFPYWSPDGRRIAFVGQNEIAIIFADGLGPLVRIPAEGGVNKIDWSPDGQQVVFEVAHWLGKRTIWMAGADGSNLHRIAEDAYDPDWSPDGKSILYSRFDATQRLPLR